MCLSRGIIAKWFDDAGRTIVDIQNESKVKCLNEAMNILVSKLEK